MLESLKTPKSLRFINSLNSVNCVNIINHITFIGSLVLEKHNKTCEAEEQITWTSVVYQWHQSPFAASAARDDGRRPSSTDSLARNSLRQQIDAPHIQHRQSFVKSDKAEWTIEKSVEDAQVKAFDDVLPLLRDSVIEGVPMHLSHDQTPKLMDQSRSLGRKITESSTIIPTERDSMQTSTTRRLKQVSEDSLYKLPYGLDGYDAYAWLSCISEPHHRHQFYEKFLLSRKCLLDTVREQLHKVWDTHRRSQTKPPTVDEVRERYTE